MKLRETHKHFKTLIFMTDLSMNQVIYNLWKQFSKASTVLCNPYYMIKDMSNISLISYHNTKHKDMDTNYMLKKNKEINIYIK